MAASKNLIWSVSNITIERNIYSELPEITATLTATGRNGDIYFSKIMAEDLLKLINNNPVPEIKNVIFNDPATIVLWSDNSKTVVKCQEGDEFDPEKGLAMAIVKKLNGNTGKYCEIFKKWIKEESDYPFITMDMYKKFQDKIADRMTLTLINQALFGSSARKSESNWTPTSEKMPDKSGDYLVSDAFTGGVYVYEYGKDCPADNSYWRTNISHWMPCPEAPVKKKEV